MIVTAYRITKAAFARTMWSGIGARDYGGRWNSKGVAVVYAAGCIYALQMAKWVLRNPVAIREEQRYDEYDDDEDDRDRRGRRRRQRDD